jgi:hypothetical protein
LTMGGKFSRGTPPIVSTVWRAFTRQKRLPHRKPPRSKNGPTQKNFLSEAR